MLKLKKEKEKEMKKESHEQRMARIKRKREGGQLRVNEWKSTVKSDSVQPGSEREECLTHFMSLCHTYFFFVSQHAKNIKPIPLSLLTHTHTTHTHTQSRRTEDGNYEHYAAARQQREK